MIVTPAEQQSIGTCSIHLYVNGTLLNRTVVDVIPYN